MDKAREAYARAKADGADILVLPEQFIIGCLAEDLVLKPSAVADCKAHAQSFANWLRDISLSKTYALSLSNPI